MRTMPRTGSSVRHNIAFTLIELMGVVLVIAILAGIILGLVGYIQRRVAVSAAKSQIAAIESALEMYKSDWGYYPVSTIARISGNGGKEGSNNLCLYRALSGLSGGKSYLRFPAAMIRTNTQVWTAPGTVNFGVFDPWGTLYNYYCSPNTAFGLANNVYCTNAAASGYAVGGQINVAAYDLFSYGPDKVTYVAPGVNLSGSCGSTSTSNLVYDSWSGGPWANSAYWKPGSASDDITNWKQ